MFTPRGGGRGADRLTPTRVYTNPPISNLVPLCHHHHANNDDSHAADASSPTEAPSPTNQKPPSTTAKPRPAACSTPTAPHLGPATTAGCHPGRPSTRSTWTSGGTSTPKLNSTAVLLMTPRTLRTATALTRATTSTTCRRACGSPQRKTR